MTEQKKWNYPPGMMIDTNSQYMATIDTELGKINVALHADKVPVTVNNFIFLSKNGFYDNTIFHRVIDNFMAQGGDPTGTGRGGPGYKFNDEFHAELRHDREGILSMANAGPNTNGSQFFITHLPTPWLDNKHSVFGEVITGMDVVLSIPARDPQNPNNPGVKINSIKIEESSNSTK